MEWIPITERLPQESCDCIIQTDILYNRKVVKSMIQVSSFSLKHHEFNCFDWQTTEEARGTKLCGVVAWMPMPAFYAEKEGIHEDV